MKIFANKNIWKKLVLILLIITIFSFGAPKTVQADNDEDSGGIGGVLMKPICNILVGIGDGVVNVIHRFVVDQETTLIRVDLESGHWGLFVACVVIAILAAAASIAAGILSLGLSYVIGAALVALASGYTAFVIVAGGNGVVGGVIQYLVDGLGDTVNIPVYSLSPEEIFKGEIPLFDVNFFDTEKWETGGEMEDYTSLSYSLSGIVAKWYYILLRIGIVAMLSVLVYIGIRILISSAASDKAKYKQMLGDWLIGLILLFTLHYIMIFATQINDALIELVENTGYRTYECVFSFNTTDDKTAYTNIVDAIEDEDRSEWYCLF